MTFTFAFPTTCTVTGRFNRKSIICTEEASLKRLESVAKRGENVNRIRKDCDSGMDFLVQNVTVLIAGN